MKSRSVARAALLLCFLLAAGQMPWAQNGNRNTIFAQKLVEEIQSRHVPQMFYLGLHAVPPNSLTNLGLTVLPPNGTEMFVIAATDPAKIGKFSGFRPWLFRAPEIELKGNETTLLEPLHDRSGKIIGLIVADFKFGDEQASETARFRKLLDREFAEQIPSLSALFERVSVPVVP